MKHLKQHFLLLVIVLITYQVVYAQSPKSLSEQERVRDFFIKNAPWETTKDSTMVYAFAFKTLVKKDKKGNLNFISLTATDSVAYQIFPGYKFLETVDYKLFMKGKEQAEFVFPVTIQIIGSQPDSYYNNNVLRDYLTQNVSRQRFIEKAESLFSRKLNQHYDIENIIYFGPTMLWLDKKIKF